MDEDQGRGLVPDHWLAPCIRFSFLQELNITVNGNNPGWMEEFLRRKAKAIEHIRFCCTLYMYQLMGKHFLHEHPWTARSWNLDCIQSMSDPRVQLVQGHMCQFGMLTHVDEKPGENGPVKRRLDS